MAAPSAGLSYTQNRVQNSIRDRYRHISGRRHCHGTASIHRMRSDRDPICTPIVPTDSQFSRSPTCKIILFGLITLLWFGGCGKQQLSQKRRLCQYMCLLCAPRPVCVCVCQPLPCYISPRMRRPLQDLSIVTFFLFHSRGTSFSLASFYLYSRQYGCARVYSLFFPSFFLYIYFLF